MARAAAKQRARIVPNPSHEPPAMLAGLSDELRSFVFDLALEHERRADPSLAIIVAPAMGIAMLRRVDDAPGVFGAQIQITADLAAAGAPDGRRGIAVAVIGENGCVECAILGELEGLFGALPRAVA